jgi:hypothetical protein
MTVRMSPSWQQHDLLVLPRYTGFIASLQETYAKTPMTAQVLTNHPPADSFLYTCRSVAPVITPTRDPCNFPSVYKPRHEPVVLWPQLQTKGNFVR